MNAIPRHAALLQSEGCRTFLADRTVPVPDPTAIRRVGSHAAEDFLQTGFLLRETLREAAGLAPDQAILDIGCGWGRLALPLARFLDARGHYVGMDVAAEAVAWCRRMIGATDPRFRFHHVDARSSYANPTGRVPPAMAVLLPWEEHFDLVVATSLFTHMLPDGTARYLTEAGRLCRPGGVLFATFFLLDEEAERLCAEGRSRHSFPQAHGPARIANPAVPEDAVAYEPGFVLARLDEAGFDAELRPGGWCDRAGTPFDYQDVVIARRRGTAPRGRGTRAFGAVEALARGRLRGWAWNRGEANITAPRLLIEVDGKPVEELRPDLPRQDLPAAGPPPGAPCGFVWKVPPHLLGRRPRHLRVTLAEGGPVLFDRAELRLTDPAAELVQAWRREAVARGLWRLEALEWRAEGNLEGLGWAVPPRGGPGWDRFRLFADAEPVAIERLDRAEPALGAALGLPDPPRPWFRFALPLPAAARTGGPLRLTLGLAAQAPFDPPEGFLLAPWAADSDPLGASEALTIEAALRRHFGCGFGGFGATLDWRGGLTRRAAMAANACRLVPPDRMAAASACTHPPMPIAAGSLDLVLAIGVFETLEEDSEAAWLGELERIAAPGAAIVATARGRGAWLAAPGSPERFLAWQRRGVLDNRAGGEAHPRMVHSPAYIEAAWGRRFAVLEVAEAALADLRDLVVMRRR